MGKLIRFINQGIKHFFIIDGEYLGDGSNQFENRLPDSFTDSQLVAVLSHLPEEFTYGLVVYETFHGREYVVLECHEGRVCDLCSEVGGLALTQSEQPLALLEDDLLRPAPGVNPVCLEESQREVCREQSAPWTSFAATDEEQADMGVCKDDIGTDVPALELAAVLLLAPFVQFLDNGRSGEVFAFKAILGLTFFPDLYHADVVASDMTGADEAYYLGAGKPAVCQHVTEMNLVLDGSADHLNGEVNLAHGILIKTPLYGSVLIPFRGVSSGEFLLAHSIVALLALLTEDGKVEQHLADTVGNVEEEGLEAEDAAVFKM